MINIRLLWFLSELGWDCLLKDTGIPYRAPTWSFLQLPMCSYSAFLVLISDQKRQEVSLWTGCLLDSAAFGRRGTRWKWDEGSRMSITKLWSAFVLWLDVADSWMLCGSFSADVQSWGEISRILTYCYLVGLHTSIFHSAESQQIMQLWQADLSSWAAWGSFGFSAFWCSQP